jgi:alkylation response protein AidB-like acyl-CoA dehydrogenase
MSEVEEMVGTEVAGAVGTIAELAAGPIADMAAAVDRDRVFPEAGIAALREAGALRLAVPADDGGIGGGLAELAQACEALGGACASTAMVFLMHSVGAATLAAGRGEGAEAALAAIVADGALASLAFSERGTGAHFYSPELQAQRHNGGVRVSGRKSFVTSAGHAQVYIVLLQSAETEGAADAYLIPRDAAGLGFDGTWSGLGMAGNSSIAIEFDAVEIPDAARLGAAGSGLDLVFSAVAPWFMVGLAAVNVGIAGAATGAAIAHASAPRYGDGSSLAEIQSIQHQLARMHTRTRAARLLVEEAARLGDAGDEAALVAIMEAKVEATDAAAAVSQEALEVTGGQGYTDALPIERHLRDARAGAVMAPTNGVLRNWIGKALTGLPVP